MQEIKTEFEKRWGIPQQHRPGNGAKWKRNNARKTMKKDIW